MTPEYVKFCKNINKVYSLVSHFKLGMSITRIGKKYGLMRFQVEQIIRDWMICNPKYRRL